MRIYFFILLSFLWMKDIYPSFSMNSRSFETSIFKELPIPDLLEIAYADREARQFLCEKILMGGVLQKVNMNRLFPLNQEVDLSCLSSFELAIMIHHNKYMAYGDLFFIHIEEQANGGNTDYMNLLGTAYFKGQGREQNIEKALYFYQLAADKNNPWAQYNLGFLYEHGQGVSPDVQEAERLYKLAADIGLAPAQNKWGQICWDRQDYGQAFTYFKQSADQGNIEAQYYVGHMYQCGKGVIQNDEEAFYYFKQSAGQGYAPSQYSLGDMYYKDTCMFQDNQKAAHYFKLAADQGISRAQYNLGIMYEYGYGIDQDLQKAENLYRQAIKQGYEEASDCLIDLYSKIKDPKDLS